MQLDNSLDLDLLKSGILSTEQGESSNIFYMTMCFS